MATIRKRGEKWQVQFRRKGHNSITRSFLHRRDANTWERQAEVQADRNEIPCDLTVLKTVTLRDLVKRYRDTVTPRKQDSGNESIVLNAFLRHPICDKSISELKPKDFAKYRDDRLIKVKPQTIKRQFNPLHNMFEVARYEWGLPIRENPIGLVKLDYKDTRRERRLRPGERAALLEAANRYRNPLVLPIIRIALETAMRRGEILGMKWEHLNNSLFIPDTKNGYSRRIPMTNTALEIIDCVEEIVRTYKSEVMHQRIGSAFEVYLSYDDSVKFKVLAIDSYSGLYGLSNGQTSLNFAINHALAKCELHGSDCKLYALGNKRVLGMSQEQIKTISKKYEEVVAENILSNQTQ